MIAMLRKMALRGLKLLGDRLTAVRTRAASGGKRPTLGGRVGSGPTRRGSSAAGAGPDKELVRSIEALLASYCVQRAAFIPAGRATLDHAVLNALVASLDGVSAERLRECGARQIFDAYRALRKAGLNDLLTGEGKHSATIRLPLNDHLSRLAAIQIRSSASDVGKAIRVWFNVVLVEYVNQSEGDRLGAMRRVVTSPYLRSLLLHPEGHWVLGVLADAVSTRPVASTVIWKIAAGWREILDRRCRADGISRVHAAMEFLLESRAGPRASISVSRHWSMPDDPLVAAPAPAQDLWLHMVGLLIPRVKFYGEPEGEARIEHYRERLVQRFRDYPSDVARRFLAAYQLAAWLPLPPFVQPLCGAIMAWCYWNADDPMQRPIKVYSNGESRTVWPKTFDRYTALANKPVHWSELECVRGDCQDGSDYEPCMVCGTMTTVPSHQYEGLQVSGLCSACRTPWTRPEAASDRIDRNRDMGFTSDP